MRIGIAYHSQMTNFLISGSVAPLNGGVAPSEQSYSSTTGFTPKLQCSVTSFINNGVGGDAFQLVYLEANLGSYGGSFVPVDFLASFPKTATISNAINYNDNLNNYNQIVANVPASELSNTTTSS